MHNDVKQLIITTKTSFKDGKKNKETIRQWLESAGIDPKRRGETLTIQDFATLYEQKKNSPN